MTWARGEEAGAVITQAAQRTTIPLVRQRVASECVQCDLLYRPCTLGERISVGLSDREFDQCFM